MNRWKEKLHDKDRKNGMRIQLDENTLALSFQKEDGREWRWDEHYAPYMECAEGNVFFVMRLRSAMKRSAWELVKEF